MKLKDLLKELQNIELSPMPVKELEIIDCLPSTSVYKCIDKREGEVWFFDKASAETKKLIDILSQGYPCRVKATVDTERKRVISIKELSTIPVDEVELDGVFMVSHSFDLSGLDFLPIQRVDGSWVSAGQRKTMRNTTVNFNRLMRILKEKSDTVIVAAKLYTRKLGFNGKEFVSYLWFYPVKADATQLGSPKPVEASPRTGVEEATIVQEESTGEGTGEQVTRTGNGGQSPPEPQQSSPVGSPEDVIKNIIMQAIREEEKNQ